MPSIPAPVGFAFATEPNSPFSDGYSIAKEEAALAEYMAGPMSETDPLYDRYIELEDRKDRLERRKVEFDGRKGAESVVTRQEARSCGFCSLVWATLVPVEAVVVRPA